MDDRLIVELDDGLDNILDDKLDYTFWNRLGDKNSSDKVSEDNLDLDLSSDLSFEKIMIRLIVRSIVQK